MDHPEEAATLTASRVITATVLLICSAGCRDYGTTADQAVCRVFRDFERIEGPPTPAEAKEAVAKLRNSGTPNDPQLATIARKASVTGGNQVAVFGDKLGVLKRSCAGVGVELRGDQ